MRIINQQFLAISCSSHYSSFVNGAIVAIKIRSFANFYERFKRKKNSQMIKLKEHVVLQYAHQDNLADIRMLNMV
jgi:hypothetical protein